MSPSITWARPSSCSTDDPPRARAEGTVLSFLSWSSARPRSSIASLVRRAGLSPSAARVDPLSLRVPSIGLDSSPHPLQALSRVRSRGPSTRKEDPPSAAAEGGSSFRSSTSSTISVPAAAATHRTMAGTCCLTAGLKERCRPCLPASLERDGSSRTIAGRCSSRSCPGTRPSDR